MFRLIPPAGTPISLIDLFKITGHRFSGRDVGRSFRKRLVDLTGSTECFFFSSGRAALYVAIKALRELADPRRDEVVLPAYTCFSVPASIARAGLRVRLVDIDPMTLDYNFENFERMDFSKVLAIAGCNMFGILSDWNRLRGIAARHGIFTVDDAAQSLGSRYDGKPSGSLGDFGILSFGRGKNLSLYSGGALVTNRQDLSDMINRHRPVPGSNGSDGELSSAVKLALYALFLKPGFYWLPSLLPFLGLGETVYDENFIVDKLKDIQLCAGDRLSDKLERNNHVRMENSRKLIEGLRTSGEFNVPGSRCKDLPVYLRLPVIVRDSETRDKLLIRLRRNGIAASKMYPSTLRRIGALEKHLADGGDNYPGSQLVVDRILCLPTHPYLSARDIDRMIDTLTRG